MPSALYSASPLTRSRWHFYYLWVQTELGDYGSIQTPNISSFTSLIFLSPTFLFSLSHPPSLCTSFPVQVQTHCEIISLLLAHFYDALKHLGPVQASHHSFQTDGLVRRTRRKKCSLGLNAYNVSHICACQSCTAAEWEE